MAMGRSNINRSTICRDEGPRVGQRWLDITLQSLRVLLEQRGARQELGDKNAGLHGGDGQRAH